MDPKSGFKKRTKKWVHFPEKIQGHSSEMTPPPQVTLFYQWIQWLHCSVLREREAVWLNLDESPIPLGVPTEKGYQMFSDAGSRRRARQPVPQSDTRSHATLVATICNRPELQPHVPQFLLTKDKRMTPVEQALLRDPGLPLVWVPGSN